MFRLLDEYARLAVRNRGLKAGANARQFVGGEVV
jgi:hypothetical protein